MDSPNPDMDEGHGGYLSSSSGGGYSSGSGGEDSSLNSDTEDVSRVSYEVCDMCRYNCL